jgi:hypothetical protein
VLDRLDQQSSAAAWSAGRREAAFVADRRRHALAVDQLLQRWNTSAPQRSASRNDCAPTGTIIISCMSSVVVGVRAAVDHVHHRHRHLHRARAAEVAVQRQAGFLGRRLGRRHRHREHRVGAQARLVLVPSRSISVLSMNACSVASRPTMASEISVLTASTAFSTPLPP